MERTLSGHDVYEDDEIIEDRRSRFHGLVGHENGVASQQSRASSQPPRTSENITSLFSSPPAQHFMPSSLGGAWSSSRGVLSSNRTQPTPIRSSSFTSQSHFGSAMRDSHFPSTFEDDESEALDEIYDDRFLHHSLSGGRGRSPFGHDLTRSRSQSLATGRQAPIGSSPYLGTATAMQSFNESYLSSNGLKPPGPSRFGSLGGGMGGAPIGRHDISNMSPFVRDIGSILQDDDVYAGLGMNPRDENGGGSGTTSRRHSVSVVQPRRGNVIGFNAPGASDLVDEQPKRTTTLTNPQTQVFGAGFASASSGIGGGRSGGGLMLSDDDLAEDLGMLNLGPTDSGSHKQPPSQPSSLPIYAPTTRSPVAGKDLLANYQAINLSIPPTGSYSRQTIGTPSDGGYDGGNNSPSITAAVFEQRLAEARAAQQQKEAEFRYQLLQQQRQEQQQAQINSGQYVRTRAPSYSNASGALHSPISPTAGSRLVNPQQPPFYPQTQRRLSDAHAQPPTPSSTHAAGSLAELGKGLPLHAVPPNWPLFIVEFKAGRTDLFYLPPVGTSISLPDVSPDRDIRVGDLVIVEADRGKDLGKVVNDRITLEEVEAFQRMQAEKSAGGASANSPTASDPTSPGGVSGDGGAPPPTPGSKKDINPKMIYGKAGQQDVQLYAAKTQDEQKALQLCQSKVRAKKLPMEVIDAEYQWDRRKLTFYFIAEKRIDFRELVRELFRLYKTRIWMASLQGGVAFEQ